MDCRTAQSWLEVVSAASAPPEHPEVAAALRHSSQCPDCEQVVQRRRQVDLRIGRAMRDIEIPAGLESRLLASLERSQPASTPDTTEAPARRRLGWRSTAVAVCAALLIAIVGWQLSRPSGVQLSQADFSRLAAIEPHQLTEFAGRHTAELPAGWSAVPGRFAIQGPKGLPSTEAAHPFVAVYTFQLRQRSGMISGMLLVVPRAQVAHPPNATRLNLSDVSYSAGYAWTDWSSGDTVYVCYVRGGGANLEQLKRWLDEASPLS